MSFNYCEILAVCWLMIFAEQLRMNNSQDTQYSGFEGLDAIRWQENATNLHKPPKKSPECLPRDDYHDLLPIGIYKLHNRAATWSDARNICREEGTHLAIINSKAEATVLSMMLSRMGNVRNAEEQDRAYLGIHDLFKEGEWVSVLDDSIYATGYTVWTAKWGGQPDNNGEQDCGSILNDGTLDDINCSAKLAFFCEKPHPYPTERC